MLGKSSELEGWLSSGTGCSGKWWRHVPVIVQNIWFTINWAWGYLVKVELDDLGVFVKLGLRFCDSPLSKFQHVWVPWESLRLRAAVLCCRTPWRCAARRRSSGASSLPSAISTRWWRNGASLAPRAGTAHTPSALETSPSLSVCSTTTCRPAPRWGHHSGAVCCL